jgi:hypothetical protein
MPRFENSRDIQIAADPATVRALITDFREWTRWSPWEEIDPQLKRTYEGAEQGVGARYAWEGNKRAGTGTMEIVRATEQEIEIDLRFLKPFKARNTAIFQVTGNPDGTHVVWAMSGERNRLLDLAGRLFLDNAIAKDFDKGLAKLKAAAES